MNHNLRMRVMKAFVNLAVRSVGRVAAFPRPVFPQSQLFLRVYARLMHLYRLECTQGFFDVPDGNFERLLRVT
jgi:hypothetical protein